MSALPAELYRDPCLVVASMEAGDVMPVKVAYGKHSCATCVHSGSSIPVFFHHHRWRRKSCDLNCMPSKNGGCALWGAQS